MQGAEGLDSEDELDDDLNYGSAPVNVDPKSMGTTNRNLIEGSLDGATVDKNVEN